MAIAGVNFGAPAYRQQNMNSLKLDFTYTHLPPQLTKFGKLNFRIVSPQTSKFAIFMICIINICKISVRSKDLPEKS